MGVIVKVRRDLSERKRFTDPTTVAASPGLGVLSATAHGARKADVLDALHAGLDKIDPEKAAKYIGYSLRLLSDTDGHKALEKLMMADTFESTSAWTESLEAKGEAKAILRLLSKHGIEVPEEARERISQCQDADMLDTWLERAVTAATVDELFDE
ncbi:hypothetical protein AB0I72_17105 [Nocardiopsis sp. NPDC049922]|uniref:hypothetical protein n=1 Tax=Nocardiopsis sp. NPDC049922 TaxID=3155157 RepID=UPI00340B56CA